ncbi:MAG TPA: bifunctional isocitrate dehydrogenase kinase/phosphatase, partial [Myxococcaceae bacterium]|nr:bifunctional isocitrate dehydrogenase kinase/phosphatase [Myxococcaceae bacterium]
MKPAPLDPAVTRWCADAICGAFTEYHRHFRQITARARQRFASRDWAGHQQDALERLEIVSDVVHQIVMVLRAQLGPPVRDKGLWERMKELYCGLAAALPEVELAETFFNSVTRRIFDTVGVDPKIEFVAPLSEPMAEGAPIFSTWVRRGSTEELLTRILRDFPLGARYRDPAADARLGAERIDRYFQSLGEGVAIDAIDLVRSVFYRGKGAYLVGRAHRRGWVSPIILAFLHPDEGIHLDAILLADREARIAFSFTRSYFHVEVDRPRELIAFLKSILPTKRLSELYISIGYNKHGKTELYREILAALAKPEARFERAEGDRGMVMLVFTLSPLDMVFKVIRDRFAPPKSTTRDEVKQKYGLVFRQDRAGRLVDAQEFEHLAFDAARFDPALLSELLAEAGDAVHLQGGQVIIDHLFVQRRVTPLNLYIRDADFSAARDAVLDYGQCIKDLAATNTFPGDLLLKNFGVTRSGRVIFYDY